LNKQKFTQIVKDYQHISAEDRKALNQIAAENPYSQIVHTLVAKAHADAKTGNTKATLGYAAMYATDRGVLKTIIAPQSSPSKKFTETAEQKEIVKKTQVDQSADNRSEEEDFWLSRTVMHDLEDLRESKKKYNEWLEIYEKEAAEEKKEASKTSSKKSAPSKKSSGKSKTEEKGSTETIADTKSSLKKAISKSVKVKKKDSEPVKSSKKSCPDSKKTTSSKSAKKEIKSKSKSKKSKVEKKSLKKNDDSQPDQIELIEKFISKEPSITNKASRESVKNQEDLSQPSTEFKEDLVSENLAKIMVSQGKNEKAVDIYKKLIWKFPQKKSYFALQIEKLKNN